MNVWQLLKSGKDGLRVVGEIHRRTFEAAKHPAGSPERVRLNMDVRTSEYYPSQPWMLRVPARMSDGTPNPAQQWHTWTYKTKAAALKEAEGRAE